MFASALAHYDMLSPGDRVLAAVSGGPDSVALLHFLRRIGPEAGIALHVAHLHHGLRGKDADDDAEFVRSLAQRLGLPASLGAADTLSLKAEQGGSVQEAARRARYAFLEATARSAGANKIALGHNEDDQAETILLNLLRGTGPKGLTGMPPVRLPYIRPLIETSRAEILAYCEREGLAFREDPSNLKTDYLRNRIRHKLLPLLESEYHPGVRRSLLRLARLLSDDASIAEEAAELSWRDTVSSHTGERTIFSRPVFEALPAALQRRLLRKAIEAASGDLMGVSFGTIEGILASFRERLPFEHTLPGGLAHVAGDSGFLKVARSVNLPEIAPFAYPLAVPGVAVIPETGQKITARYLPESPAAFPLPESGEAVLDADRLRGPLTVRNRRAGDRMQPLGMQGSKKLHDLFIDRKIPRSERPRLAVVADEGKIVWVAGIALSELVKVTGRTQRWLWVRIEEAGRSGGSEPSGVSSDCLL